MLKEENEILTRTGPGTPMGDVMRRYWVPALLSTELPAPDGPPLRLRLLGEKLVAFRATSGEVGLLEELCAHRCASLFLGRNEENGLRCVYHGWKYDVNGQCIDMPNEPARNNFQDRVRMTAYPTVEFGGIIWTYMGPPERQPAPPQFEFTQVPDTHRRVSKTWEECNWLQALEGGIDTAHISFLHHGLAEREHGPLPEDDPRSFRTRAQAPELEVDLTTYGYRYAGIRDLGAQGIYVRGYHFVMPWTQIRPTQAQSALESADGIARWKPSISGHFWVPMDDENCMVWNWSYSYGDEPFSSRYGGDPTLGAGEAAFRKPINRGNDWLIDREVQRTRTYTGIDGINNQDHAVQESMGSIVDRTREHLGSTDRAIVAARQLLAGAARTVQAGGDPLGVGTEYYALRGIEKIIPRGTPWRDELLPEMYQHQQEL